VADESLVAPSATAPVDASRDERNWRSYLAASEIDTRLAGLFVALIAIWLTFHLLSDGDFITSRNLWNLSVQSASIAIMATGMVLIIVSRNIDLSVGSLLGFLGYFMGMIQTRWIPISWDLGYNRAYTWIIAVLAGIALGAIVGALQGFVVAYGGVPAFIVTLGGFLAWRGLIFRLGAKGQTLSPLDDRFGRIGGGGKDGSLGEMRSWLLAILGCAAICASTYFARRRRQRFNLGVRPMGVDIGLAAFSCIVVIAAVGLVFNGYESPITGDPTGVAYPVVILIFVTIIMTYVSKRRRFGRYVYAYGGNPEAAELGGINTRRTVMFTFVLMGVLCAVSAAVQTARLDSATTGLGVQNELDVISAAVIGGVSFAGGIGTIFGAVLGAVVMQSLRSGMALLHIDSPSQDIVVGVVLVTAVAVDAQLRKASRVGVLVALLLGLGISAFIIQTGR